MKTAVIVILAATTVFGAAGWIRYNQAYHNLKSCRAFSETLKVESSHLRDTLRHYINMLVYVPDTPSGSRVWPATGMVHSAVRKTGKIRTWKELVKDRTMENNIPMVSYRSEWIGIMSMDSLSDSMIAMDTATFRASTTVDYRTDTATVYSYLNGEMERITKVEVKDELNVLVYKYRLPGENKRKDWKWKAVINHRNPALQNTPVTVRSLVGDPVPIEIVGGHEDVIPRSQ